MYNMNTSISIGSKKFTFRLEILVLIVVAVWILWGHVLCSCSKIGINEGFAMINGASGKKKGGYT